ncbi:hypothetical protein NB689_000835 [Xanthomonas sacchari]|nr:hypothetical protein [Xanthomonas sacchari]MCW0415081.1 hypothetical protein [Xanthomonas sacchari]
MDGSRDLAVLDLVFVPNPGHKDAPDAQFWLDANFSVFTPALLESPLKTLEDQQDYGRFSIDQQAASFFAAITARLSLVCRGRKPIGVADLRAIPNQTSAILSTLKAGLPLAQGLLDWSLSIAKSTGNTQVRCRSDNAWIGGSSPSAAWLVLPTVEKLPALVANLEAFLRNRDQGEVNCAYFEAVAYQMLCIHALSDGNGRATRTLLINLAMHYRSLYPLYIAHCLCFAKESAGSTWMQLSISEMVSRPKEVASWLSHALNILRHIDCLLSQGLDRRVLQSLLAYGYVSKETLTLGKSACSQSLAEKVISRMSGILQEEEGQFYSLELEVLIMEIVRVIYKDIL